MTKTDVCGFVANTKMNVQKRFGNCVPIHQYGTRSKEHDMKRDPNMLFLLRRSNPNLHKTSAVDNNYDWDSCNSSMDETHAGRHQSGESVIKNYYFKSSRCNSEVTKIHAFWKRIEEEQWAPAKCKVARSETEEVQKKGEQEEFLWYNALVEMKNRKMDELAFLGKRKLRCKMCETEVAFEKLTTKTYTKENLLVEESVAALNEWSSKSIPRKEKDRTRKKAIKTKTCNNCQRIPSERNSVESIEKVKKEVQERAKCKEVNRLPLTEDSKKKIEKYLYPLKYRISTQRATYTQ